MANNFGFLLNFVGHAVIDPPDSHGFPGPPFDPLLLLHQRVPKNLIGVIMPTPTHSLLDALSTRAASAGETSLDRPQYLLVVGNDQQFLDAVEGLLRAVVAVAGLAFGEVGAGQVARVRGLVIGDERRFVKFAFGRFALMHVAI